MVRPSAKPLFAATRRQLGPRRNLEIEVNDGSPLIIVGGMLAGIAVGYLVRGQRQPKDQLNPGRLSAWT